MTIPMESSGNNRLTRRERLGGRSTIKAVFSARRVSCRGMSLFYRDNKLGLSRLLVTTRKGYGNAIARNRARRTGREFYRQNKADIATGYDLAFAFYPGEYPTVDRNRQMRHVLRDAGLLQQEAANKTGPWI